MRPTATLSDRLHRAAVALHGCRKLLTRIEKAVLEPQQPHNAIDLQAIDILSQRLGDLAIWLAGLAEEVPVPQLLSQLALDDMRHELEPRGRPRPLASPSAELF